MGLPAEQYIDEQKGIAAAAAAMGFSSTDTIVVVLILCTLLMGAVFVITVLIDGAREYQQAQATAKWACTVDTQTPTFVWHRDTTYACFLSHYKQEAASDCRYLHDILCKMLRSPIYYDSSTLSDLRTLFTDGVHQSDVIVLLATKGVLTRPWCLLEIFEAARH